MRMVPVLAAFLSVMLAGCNDGGDADGSPPTARFSHSCVEFLCTFDGSESTDADGGELNYYWQFGDGAQAAGQVVSHAYSDSGTASVTLTVVNSTAKSGKSTQEVSVSGNAAAKYYNGVHDALAVLLLMDDTVKALQKTGDALQDNVEALGAPSGDGYAIDCPEGGTAGITAWTDANGNGVIDGSETLAFEADDCGYAGDTLTSTGEVRLSGDFDGNAFGIGGDRADSGRFFTGHYPAWAIQGEIAVTATRTADAIDALSYNSTDLETFHVRASGSTDLRLQTPVELHSNFDGTTGLSGEMTVAFTEPVVLYPMAIQQPLDFGTVGDDLQLLAGKIGIEIGDDRVDISVDSDTAYLKVEVDLKNDGTINLIERFPQSITVERLTET